MAKKETKSADSDGASAPGPSFVSLHAVVDHLKGAGYRISKSKIYRDKDKGTIRVNPDGTVLETEVRAYAATLDRLVADIGDLTDIHAIKTQRDVELREEQIKKLRLQRKVEEGKYIPRKDFEAELSSRAVVLDSGLRHMVQMKAAEWVALSCGKTEKIPELILAVNQELDRLMNGYASIESYHVMFHGDGEVE